MDFERLLTFKINVKLSDNFINVFSDKRKKPFGFFLDVHHELQCSLVVSVACEVNDFTFVYDEEGAAEGRTIIFVTHNPEIAQYSSRTITLRDGLIKEDVVNNNILSAAETLATIPIPDEQ